MASKDDSLLDLQEVELVRCAIGYTAYQKKPEFGPGHIRLVGLSEEEIGRRHLLEAESSIVIDGSALAPNERKVEDVLYGIEYGKSSK